MALDIMSPPEFADNIHRLTGLLNHRTTLTNPDHIRSVNEDIAEITKKLKAAYFHLHLEYLLLQEVQE